MPKILSEFTLNAKSRLGVLIQFNNLVFKFILCCGKSAIKLDNVALPSTIKVPSPISGDLKRKLSL